MSDLTSYELDGRIATIAMDDGKVNALSIDMLEALHADFDRAEQDKAVVILTGREETFSAGFDLKVFKEQPERIVEMLTLGARLCERMLSFPTPVLIASNGNAIAAGGFLLLSADVRIGAEGAFRIGLNEVKIGLTMPLFVVELARARLTPAEFNRATITARLYDPEEAAAAGFLDRTVPHGELAAAARAEAEELAALHAEAHAGTKERVRGEALKAVRTAIETELEAVAAPKSQS
jgi:enoyl-CoA hydratase